MTETRIGSLTPQQLPLYGIDPRGQALFTPCQIMKDCWYISRNDVPVSPTIDGKCTNRLAVSPNGRSFASIFSVDGKFQVLSSYTTGKMYDVILDNPPIFVSGGAPVFYVAKAADKWYGVIDQYHTDGISTVGFDAIDPKSVVLSPDMRYLAFSAKLNNKWGVVVIDNARGKRPPGDTSLQNESAPYDEIGPFLFTADSDELVYAAKKDEQWQIFDKKTTIKSPGRIGTLTLSPDSYTVVFSVKIDEKWHIAKYAPVKILEHNIAPNKPPVRTYLLKQYPPGQAYDEVGKPVISPDNDHIAFPARIENTWCIVESACIGMEETAGIPYDYVSTPRFSADSKHLVYTARKNETWSLIVDGKPLGKAVDELGAVQLHPEALHTLVAARVGEHWHAMIDGVLGPAYQEVVNPLFSLDGAHTAYVARDNAGWWVVLDDQRIGPYDGILNNMVYADTATTFHVLAYKDRPASTSANANYTILRVNIELRE